MTTPNEAEWKLNLALPKLEEAQSIFQCLDSQGKPICLVIRNLVLQIQIIRILQL